MNERRHSDVELNQQWWGKDKTWQRRGNEGDAGFVGWLRRTLRSRRNPGLWTMRPDGTLTREHWPINK